MSNLNAALRYFELGWKPIPIKPNSKIPMIKGWTKTEITEDKIKQWWTENPDANIGIITGATSGIVALDIDGGYKLGKEMYIPPTVMQRTQSGGVHYIFKHPGFKVTGTVRILRDEEQGGGVDIRGDGQQIVVAPSKIGDKGYEWTIDPFDETPAELPTWAVELLKTTSKDNKLARAKAADYLEGVGEGERNVSAASVAGTLIRSWPRDKAWSLFKIWNESNKPPMEERELSTVFTSIWQSEQNKTGDTTEIMGAEKSALSGMLAFPEIVIQEAVDRKVRREDFYTKVGQRLFEVLLDLYQGGKSIDPVTVSSEVKHRGYMKEGLTSEYIHSLPLLAVSQDVCKQHLLVVKREAMFRQIERLGNKAVENARTRSVEAMDLASEISREADEILTHSASFNPLVKLADNEFEFLQYMDDTRNKRNVLPTGFKAIDERIDGIPKDGSTLIMARSNHGKTMFALNTALNVAESGKKVYYMSLEVSEFELKKRLCQILGGIPRKYLSSTNQGDINKFMEANKKLMALNDRLFLYGGGSSLEELLSATQMAVMNDGADLVIVENLDLIQISGNYGAKKWELISDASNRINNFIRQMSLSGHPFAMAILCQANRETADLVDKFPGPDNIANSDQPYRDASMVFSLLDPARIDGYEHADHFGIKCIKNNRGSVFFDPEWVLKDIPTQRLGERALGMASVSPF